MSTSKPRITISLPPRAYEVISRLSRAGDQSMSAIVTGLVELAVPSFERVVVVLERAATASEEVKEGMRSALARADRDLLPQLLEAAGQGDMFLAALGGEPAEPGAEPAQAPAPEPARKRARKAAAAGAEEGSTPVPVTRGSGGQGQGAGGPKKGAAAGLVSVPTSGVRPMKGGRRGGV